MEFLFKYAEAGKLCCLTNSNLLDLFENSVEGSFFGLPLFCVPLYPYNASGLNMFSASRFPLISSAHAFFDALFAAEVCIFIAGEAEFESTAARRKCMSC